MAHRGIGPDRIGLQQDGIAIRGLIHDLLFSDRARGAGDVHNADRYAKFTLHQRLQGARRAVRKASRGKGDGDGDRPARPAGLCLGKARGGEKPGAGAGGT